MNSDDSTTEHTLKWIWRLAVVGYAAAMFLGTHLPVSVVEPAMPSNDKLAHCSGYAVLGLLIGFRKSRSVKQASTAWLGVLAWAAFDELSQTLVGRSTELLDWLSDAVGSAGGLIAAGLLARLVKPGRFM